MCIHGKKKQSERDYVLNEFRKGSVKILIATDLAARGLDVRDIKYVINYDFPNQIEDYVHRIGRTGRAGDIGTSFSFFTDDDKRLAKDLLKLLKEAKQKIPSKLLDYAKKDNKTGNKPQYWSRPYSNYSFKDANYSSDSPSKNSPKHQDHGFKDNFVDKSKLSFKDSITGNNSTKKKLFSDSNEFISQQQKSHKSTSIRFVDSNNTNLNQTNYSTNPVTTLNSTDSFSWLPLLQPNYLNGMTTQNYYNTSQQFLQPYTQDNINNISQYGYSNLYQIPSILNNYNNNMLQVQTIPQQTTDSNKVSIPDQNYSIPQNNLNIIDTNNISLGNTSNGIDYAPKHANLADLASNLEKISNSNQNSLISNNIPNNSNNIILNNNVSSMMQNSLNIQNNMQNNLNNQNNMQNNLNIQNTMQNNLNNQNNMQNNLNIQNNIQNSNSNSNLGNPLDGLKIENMNPTNAIPIANLDVNNKNN